MKTVTMVVWLTVDVPDECLGEDLFLNIPSGVDSLEVIGEEGTPLAATVREYETVEILPVEDTPPDLAA